MKYLFNQFIRTIWVSVIVLSCRSNDKVGNNYFFLDEIPTIDSLFIGENTFLNQEDSSSKPNIILIYIDDLGYGDLGAYGCKDIPTPNIDRLAAEGIRFSASYITNPPCSPSRSSLIMGQYGQKFGKYGMARGLALPEDRPTLAKFLSNHGYVTGQIGKWDMGSKIQGPLKMGFTEVSKNPPRKEYTQEEISSAPQELKKLISKRNGRSKYICINKDGNETWLTDYDGESMIDFVNRHKNDPFFLYWSPEAVHSSNTEVPKTLTSRTPIKEKGKRQELAGAIVSIDDQIEKLLNELDKLALRKNTLIIFSSDNGPGGGGSATPYTGGKKLDNTQNEGWVRVPTIFSMPGTLPEGKKYSKLIANFDFYSTISALATQTIPKHCDGVDLFPYIKGEKKGDAHEYLFWMNNDPNDEKHRHIIAVRWQDWRLYKKETGDPWKLYNLREDPREEDNKASEHPDIVSHLAQKHAEWSQTLAPPGTIRDFNPTKAIIPDGHGWVFSATEK